MVWNVPAMFLQQFVTWKKIRSKASKLTDKTKVKGELNLFKKWQSDDLFYIIMNEIHPRFNQFCVILKLSSFILKIYLLLNIANLA